MFKYIVNVMQFKILININDQKNLISEILTKLEARNVSVMDLGKPYIQCYDKDLHCFYDVELLEDLPITAQLNVQFQIATDSDGALLHR